jgi:hypothetical protein
MKCDRQFALTSKTLRRDTNGGVNRSFFFDRADLPGYLTGNTKLFLLLDDPATDSFMAHADATKIVECLVSASRAFGVGWKLSIEGQPVGTISDGVPSEDVVNALASLFEICAMMGIDPSEMNRDEILAAHADR